MAANASVNWDQKFDQHDKDHSGTLDANEVKAILSEGGREVSDETVAALFVMCEGDAGNKKITKEEFRAGLNKITEAIAELTAIFKEIDTDNSGSVKIPELKKYLDESGQIFSSEELNKIGKGFDCDGDGNITLEEFISCCL